jgi:multidrug efflux pump subunit AcrA (membrane-fusion protein)
VKHVNISDENHLKTVPVEVVRIQGDYIFVGSGLNSGNQVIVSRLINPLENKLITIIPFGKAQNEFIVKLTH